LRAGHNVCIREAPALHWAWCIRGQAEGVSCRSGWKGCARSILLLGLGRKSKGAVPAVVPAT
jgi:hypothetical protein